MRTIRLTVLIGSLSAALALITADDALAQKKYTIDQAPTITTQFVQQHVIDIDDMAGHQIRVFELHFDYPKKDLVFAGVVVKEALARGISDYVNASGPFTTYFVYSLEDGNKIFSRSTGTSQKTTNAEGSAVVKFSYVENLIGGTGKFKGIRGQMVGGGERAVVAKSITQYTTGEYWVEE